MQFLYFRVSPGSAETLVTRGGITNHHSIAYSLSNISAKNYATNSVDMRIAMKLWCTTSVSFFETQCILPAWVLCTPPCNVLFMSHISPHLKGPQLTTLQLISVYLNWVAVKRPSSPWLRPIIVHLVQMKLGQLRWDLNVTRKLFICALNVEISMHLYHWTLFV